jgi:hypothetical protein
MSGRAFLQGSEHLHPLGEAYHAYQRGKRILDWKLQISDCRFSTAPERGTATPNLKSTQWPDAIMDSGVLIDLRYL